MEILGKNVVGLDTTDIGNGATPVERLNEDLVAARGSDECGWQSATEWSGESPQ